MSFSRDTHREATHAPRRAFLKAYVAPGGIGAELGVFWAHFAEVLVAEFAPRKLYLVDPWAKMHGQTFRDWGAYTDHGRLPTAVAKQAALDLAARHPDIVEVHEAYATRFLARLPDGHLDWVYLDARHDEASVARDLAAIQPKLAPQGVILGDDYYPDADNAHAGVKRAVDAFAAREGFELVVERHYQFVLKQGARA